MIDILMFHRVLPKSEIDIQDAYFIRGTLISQERLEEVILKYLEDGYSFTTVSSFEKNTAKKQVILTFDDGYADNYDYVLPILEKYNIKATFYPVIGYCVEKTIAPLDYYYHYVNKNIALKDKESWIFGERKKAFLNLSIKEQQLFIKTLIQTVPLSYNISYMSVVQLQKLDNLGHEIGGHSCFHDIYTKIEKDAILKDVQKTKELFFSIGISITSFAYTDGKYNEDVVEVLKNENIKYACAINSMDICDGGYFELEREFVNEKNEYN